VVPAWDGTGLLLTTMASNMTYHRNEYWKGGLHWYIDLFQLAYRCVTVRDIET